MTSRKKPPKARFTGGQCPVCKNEIKKGSRIERFGAGGWGHAACAVAACNAARINAGTTFRSQAPSTWRRK